ncbi:acyltransferase family protein [Sphingomonas floccifaciens]|uniref:Acyltransferase family protein n=1 Tax=Sphingomonas floccifaciens TaxID=1844115 RepID=A0ABW4N930_9SPHN
MSIERTATVTPHPSQDGRVGVLDGWRAISILAVLAGHWLPIGPKSLELNGAVAASGMAIFFTLSGYLITSLLLRDSRPLPFLIRRLLRILPLAWAAMIVLAVANRADSATIAANLLFYANLPPAHLMSGGEPLWSLCIEVQFYLSIAAIVTVFGRRGLYLLPLLALAITGYRITAGVPISIITWERVDEILAGAILALVFARRQAGWSLPRALTWAPIALAALLLASAHPAFGPLAYLRPYIAAAAVGTSMLGTPAWFRALLCLRPMRYIAEISYALYVIHGILSATWLGGHDASKADRYLRRPLLMLATAALAHLSTFHFERHFIELGKRLTRRGALPPKWQPAKDLTTL